MTYEGPELSRKDAVKAGLTRYFLCSPCPSGHISQRTTSNSACTTCAAERAKAHKAANRERTNEVRRVNYAANADHIRATKSVWRAENRDSELAQGAKYREANRGLLRERAAIRRETKPEIVSASWKRYYDANIEAMRQRSQDYFYANLDAARSKGRVRARVHYRSNKGRYIAHAQTRRARKIGAEGRHSHQDIIRIGNAQKWKCAWCATSCKKKYHGDHIIPLYLGGSNWPRNMCVSCPTCNLSKGKRDPLVFARRLGKLL